MATRGSGSQQQQQQQHKTCCCQATYLQWECEKAAPNYFLEDLIHFDC
jgi:hypothetical protein